jgi:2-keto-4-pentenoate hydratase/2-oxohepta-3-ene-1,7-dioic acid hydratase in catechol pathway
VKLVTYDRRGHRRLGALTGGRVVDLPDAVGHPAFPSTLESLIRNHGGTILDVARESLEREDVLEFEVPDARLLPPLLPSSIRSFDAFRAQAGTSSLAPLYTRWEHRAVLGPDDEVAWPPFTGQLDVEAQIGCVMGSGGRDLSQEEARGCIFGYVLVSGWVARDVERDERDRGIGPGKSRGVGVSMGPWVAMADELDATSVELVLKVDGDVLGVGAAADMRWTFPELVAYASLGEDVLPGDLLASGPFAGGRGVDGGQLPGPGSTVEVEGSSIGSIRSTVGPRPGPNGRAD